LTSSPGIAASFAAAGRARTANLIQGERLSIALAPMWPARQYDPTQPSSIGPPETPGHIAAIPPVHAPTSRACCGGRPRSVRRRPGDPIDAPALPGECSRQKRSWFDLYHFQVGQLASQPQSGAMQAGFNRAFADAQSASQLAVTPIFGVFQQQDFRITSRHALHRLADLLFTFFE